MFFGGLACGLELVSIGMDPSGYIFLSFNSADRKIARALYEHLTAQGMKVFFDEKELTPGQDFINRLETAVLDCSAIAILLGSRGMGKWQQIEKDLAINRKASEPDFPVVPVILPGRVDPPLGFLSLNIWIDLSSGVDHKPSVANLVAALNSLAAPDPSFRPNPKPQVCPYRGLMPFREEDAEFYFGRERELSELLERVLERKHTVIPVIGSSGSGKSSLVAAGLIPALRKQVEGRPWEIISLRPGNDPLRSLAEAISPPNEESSLLRSLSQVDADIELLRAQKVRFSGAINEVIKRSGGSDRLLIFVDQWEELYSLIPSDLSKEGRAVAERDRVLFIDYLFEAARSCACTVVFTVRADFYEPLMRWDNRLRHGTLQEQLNKASLSVGPLSRESLKIAIERPAAQAAFEFEHGLVDTILNELGDEPGNLPLLEFVLEQLWNYHSEMQENQFTLTGYDKVGRVSGAIATRAEETLRGLIAAKGKSIEAAARRVFVSLVTPAEDPSRDSRSVILRPSAGPELDVVEYFSAARLLTSSETKVELSHEALIRNWKRLRENWIQTNREFLRLRDRIRTARESWDSPPGESTLDLARSPDRLIPAGTPLKEARRLLRQHGDVLVDDIRDYIKESLRHAFWSRIWFSLTVAVGIPVFWIILFVTVFFFHHLFAAMASLRLLERDASLRMAKLNPTSASIFPGELDLAQNGGPRTKPPFHSFTNSAGMEFIWCWPGTFVMGSSSESELSFTEIAHEVTLTNGFWMARQEVTRGQWLAVTGKSEGLIDESTHYDIFWERDEFNFWVPPTLEIVDKKKHNSDQRMPIYGITWEQAVNYCVELTKREIEAGILPAGWGYGLPTEAQWEYACRAGTTTPFSFGRSLDGRRANCKGSSPYGTLMPGPHLDLVTMGGVYPENPWGFRDMHGNVNEWCRDWYADEYTVGPSVDPQGPPSGRERVCRGGDWTSPASDCRSAFRWQSGYSNPGLRPVLERVPASENL